jgi:hypothetical protein
MMRVSIPQLLDVCSPIYRTIDLRIAAVRNDGAWTNVCAAIRTSHANPHTVRAMHKDLFCRHGAIQSDYFAILTAALPISAWAEFASDIGRGILNIGGLDVRLSSVDVASLTGYVQGPSPSGFLRDPESWPAAHFASGQNDYTLLNRDEVVRAISGYQSPYQAIAALCEAETWPRMNHGYSVLLRLPIYAKLRQVRLEPLEQQLSASVEVHRYLKGIALNVVSTTGVDDVPTKRSMIKLGKRANRVGTIQERQGYTSFTPVNVDDYVETSVWHPVLGDLERRRNSVRSLLPPAAQNLLLEVLKQFCPAEKLQELLTKPNDHGDRKADQSTAFERHVAWVLSLAGFSPIVLGLMENIKAERGQRATVDIIATGGDTLLLVACTIGAPKPEDFSSLAHLRMLLLEKFEEQTTVNAIPVLVSGTTVAERYRVVDNFVIPILDIQQLREITTSLADLSMSTLLQRLAQPDPPSPLIPPSVGYWLEGQ